MPHIKVALFDTARIEALIDPKGMWRFRAFSDHRSDELWCVQVDGVDFLLHVKPFEHETLIKYDKITRPSDAELVKAALQRTMETLDLTYLSGNIAPKHKAPKRSPYELTVEALQEAPWGHKKMALEVGFGSGRHLLYQAKARPDTLFLGIEIHTPSLQQVLKQIDLQHLSNIRVLNYDARLVLEILPSNILEQIYVHFPVPWDKKPHRRVISPAFLDEAMRVLRPDGTLELRTDSENYLRYALEVFLDVPQSDLRLRKNADADVTSKYEARWRRMEKNIYDVFVRSLELSKPKQAAFDFSFGKVSIKGNRYDTLPTKPQVFGDYFVHIERVMRTFPQGWLIKCSFGNFDRPEHKYIRIDAHGARYVASLPVAIEANAKAHGVLREWLEDE